MVTLDDGTTMPFLIGGEPNSPLEGGEPDAVGPRGPAEGRRHTGTSTSNRGHRAMSNDRHGSSARRGGGRGYGGFTLVELMTAVAVLASCGIGRAEFQRCHVVRQAERIREQPGGQRPGGPQRGDQAQQRRSRLCSPPTATTCARQRGWQQGWIVADRRRRPCCSASRPADGVQHHRGGAAADLSFPGTVVGTTAATLTVCRSDARRQRGARRHDQRHRGRLRDHHDHGTCS